MNREIKFRAWDKEDNVMLYDVHDRSLNNVPFITGNNHFAYFINHPAFEVMQFTGLKDKNGVEIYEGDIVKISEGHLEVMNWVDESNWMGEKCPVNGWVNHQSIYKKPIEVIGNIYENPELLDK